MRLLPLAALAALVASPVLADGHAAKGEKIVHTKCKICHSIYNGDDVILKGGKIGPNLFGIMGRTAGHAEGYDHSKTLIEAGDEGLVWDEANLAEYIRGTKPFLSAFLGREDEIYSRMSYRVKSEDDAKAISAYLSTLN
ncbi:MAG: c-type cytochrome [Pikeienuella sp.]